MTEHTKEPWRVSGNGTMRFIDASVGNGMAQEVATCMRVEHGDMEANARRVVACVNAMAGIGDDNVLFRRGSIGTVRKHIVTQQVQIEKLTAQRDQLKASLDKLVDKAVEIEQQRDQLLAALEELEQQGWLEFIVSKCKEQISDESLFRSVTKARAAIAAAEQAQADIGKAISRQSEPRCACGDSFTTDAVCANCLAAQQQADNQSEEAAYIKWMCETFPTVYDPPLARLWIEQKHVSFLAWMERAKQPPVQQQDERECGCGWRGPAGDCVRLGEVGPLCPECRETTERAQQAEPVALPPYDTFSNDDGDSWQDCPSDAKFVNGRNPGEEFELLAGWHAERVTFRVTKVPDDENDDYEVEEVNPAPVAIKNSASVLVDALEKLARLGAGDRYGNSDGNVIAQQALASYRSNYAQPPAVAVPDAEILAHFYGGKDQDAMNYSNLRDVVYQFTQSELLCAARAMLAATPQATAEDSSVVQADAPAPAAEYSWSNNGEEYHGRFSSVAEAVCDYLDSEGDGAGEVVHVGEVKPHEPGNPIWLADNVLETLGEQAHGDVGEYVGDWPELPPEKREQLGKMIQDFVWTHDAPSFFSIGKSELVEVAAYRDDAAGQKGGA